MSKITKKAKDSKVLKMVMAKGSQNSNASTWTQSHSVHSNHNKNAR